MKVFWLRVGKYLYEASEKYILEGKTFKLTNELLEVAVENYGKCLTPLCFL